MCSVPDTMILSSSGLTGSVTQACRMCVVTGSGTPTMSQVSVLQPATQEMTVPQAIVPRLVSTPVTLPLSTLIPVTSVYWWISTPSLSASLPYPQTTASWRITPPGG